MAHGSWLMHTLNRRFFDLSLTRAKTLYSQHKNVFFTEHCTKFLGYLVLKYIFSGASPSESAIFINATNQTSSNHETREIRDKLLTINPQFVLYEHMCIINTINQINSTRINHNAINVQTIYIKSFKPLETNHKPLGINHISLQT